MTRKRRQNSCFSRDNAPKIRHINKKEAVIVARKMKKRFKVMFNAYHCPVCKFWHVGEINKHLVMREAAPELGERVADNMRKENCGAPKERRRVIVNRARALSS